MAEIYWRSCNVVSRGYINKYAYDSQFTAFMKHEHERIIKVEMGEKHIY